MLGLALRISWKRLPDISDLNIPDEATHFFGRSVQKTAKVHWPLIVRDYKNLRSLFAPRGTQDPADQEASFPRRWKIC